MNPTFGNFRIKAVGFLILLIFFGSCKNNSSEDSLLPKRQLSDNFKNYWFSGEAEISSYFLNQSRYGENREGTAVLIFVTEDFLPEAQIKANSQNEGNIAVLKLNMTKNFITGIYPYSIMQSTFYPLEGDNHALKVSTSIQEWCGQVYMQLNNRRDFEIVLNSYFEGEADKDFAIEKTYLENEIWTQLRIDPNQLPSGEIEIIPSFEYLRLAHVDLKAYKAIAEFYQDGEMSVYKISYPELQRELKIFYRNSFPFTIEGWEETTEQNGKKQITSAQKMEEIKSAYWNKNSNKDLPLRNKLNLN